MNTSKKGRPNKHGKSQRISKKIIKRKIVEIVDAEIAGNSNLVEKLHCEIISEVENSQLTKKQVFGLNCTLVDLLKEAMPEKEWRMPKMA